MKALLHPRVGSNNSEELGMGISGAGGPITAAPPPGASVATDPNNENGTARSAHERALQGVAAQLQALGYEAGVWDLMGTVQIARRALDALTSIIAAIAV